jgi:hypothetical protein
MSKQPRYDGLSRTELFQGIYTKNTCTIWGRKLLGIRTEIIGIGRWGLSVLKDRIAGMAMDSLPLSELR